MIKRLLLKSETILNDLSSLFTVLEMTKIDTTLLKQFESKRILFINDINTISIRLNLKFKVKEKEGSIL